MMTIEQIIIGVLSLAAIAQTVLNAMALNSMAALVNRLKRTEHTLSQFMKEDMRLHDTVKDRIDQIERKVNSKQPIDLPKYEKAMRDWHDRQTAETRAWDALADEAMRTVEDG